MSLPETYGTFSTAYVEAMRLRLSALEPENKDLRGLLATLEAENGMLRAKMGGCAMKPGNGEHPPRDPRQLDGLDTYPVAQVEAFVERIDELEAENKSLLDRFSDADTERNAAQGALKATFDRVVELESENKDLRKRAELADGDVKRAQAILDNSNTYIRRIEVELQRESQAKIDAEFHVAALKERVAELEARRKRLEEAAREVYLDSIASDHQWSTNETRNMHALRDALEAKS